MYKIGSVKKCAPVLLALALAASCAGTPKVPKVNFSEVQEKDWLLTEIRVGSDSRQFDREQLKSGSAGDAYSLRFDGEKVSGKGAVNRFFGPYKEGEDMSLSFEKLASTLMLPIVEPQMLTEKDYYAYLEKVSHWDLKDGRLELQTVNDRGEETFLIFEPALVK